MIINQSGLTGTLSAGMSGFFPADKRKKNDFFEFYPLINGKFPS